MSHTESDNGSSVKPPRQLRYYLVHRTNLNKVSSNASNPYRLGNSEWFLYGIPENEEPSEGSILLDLHIRMMAYTDYKRQKRGKKFTDARALMSALDGF